MIFEAIAAVAVALLCAALARERRLRARAERLRASERTGRIHAEQRIAQQQQKQSFDDGDVKLRPIGVLRSVFRQRNGTPRQAQLVPTARAVLALDASRVDAAAALDGLSAFSHCWVLFVFHANTDRASASAAAATCKAKVRPPRMGGAATGVFATRSPHHPAAVGLSLARVAWVRPTARSVGLCGLDVLDGTPVLDIKPYLGTYDVAALAANDDEVRVAPWVAAPEPLFEVGFALQASAQLAAAFAGGCRPLGSFFGSAEDAAAFVQDALKHDVRSVHRRRAGAAEHTVQLDAFDIAFAIDDAARTVTVVSVSVATAASALDSAWRW